MNIVRVKSKGGSGSWTRMTSRSVAVQIFYSDDSVNNKVAFYCCHLFQCTVHINKLYVQFSAFVNVVCTLQYRCLHHSH